MAEDKNKEGLDGIKDAVNELLNPIKTVTEAIGLMVAGAEKLNKDFGLGRSRIIEMNTAFADSAAGVEKLGGKLSDVTTTITDIAKASNRNVIENEKVVSQLYAASKILNTDAEKLVDNFKDVGYETSQIAPNLEKSIEYIQGVGLNATQVMKDVSANMEKMNRYQFEGGVAGLAKMAAQASMLRFDMAQTFSFADKMLTPENAINMASAFQRLGVTAGNLVDPFALMNESINDPTGLQNSLARLGQEFTYFDEETQSFKINPQGVLTLRQMEEEAGLAAGSLSKSALAAADLDKRLSTVSAAGLSFKSEEDKQYLANIAKMGEGGTYEVTLNDGTKKELQNLNQEEFDELIKQQKDAPKTVEDIQRSQLSALQSIAGDMKAVVDAGKFGLASTKDVTTNMEGLRNIVTKFADAGQKAIPKTPEVREAVSAAMDSFKNLFDSEKSGEIGSDKFNNNLKALEDTFLNKGKSMSEDAYKAVQDILKETANNVKGNSAIEKFFRNNLLTTPNTVSTNKTTTAKGQTVKPLSRSAVMGVGTTAKNYTETTTSSKQVNGQMDFGGTITIKVDAPPGVSEQQFKTFFESDEFKRKIYEYYNQKAKELERR
jgi:polyhydroxyalkanoate synthesis regulator phasin